MMWWKYVRTNPDGSETWDDGTGHEFIRWPDALSWHQRDLATRHMRFRKRKPPLAARMIGWLLGGWYAVATVFLLWVLVAHRDHFWSALAMCFLIVPSFVLGLPITLLAMNVPLRGTGGNPGGWITVHEMQERAKRG